MTKSESNIIMYTSSFCGHSWAVERFLNQHNIAVTMVSIDKDSQARERVMALNRGFASVPTLIFPDGTQLTEPSFRELRSALDIKQRGVADRLRSLLGRPE
jgi:mycoredoxin